MVAFYTLIVLVAAIDQGVKYLIRAFFTLNQSITLIPKALSFTYIRNPGAAFGILKNQTWVFFLLTVVLFYLVYSFRERIKEQRVLFRYGLALGLGGALGNFIDRICFEGRVIDFIDLDFWPLQNWPVFNLADVAIMIGSVIICFHLFKNENSVRSGKGRLK